MSLLLLACGEEECPDTVCADSFTVVFDGGGLLDSWTAVITDDAGREESFKCYGQEVRNLTDESLLVWCEPEGFTIAGWKMDLLRLELQDKDGSYSWERNIAWEPDYGYGEECPATCETADILLVKDAVSSDTGGSG